MPQLPEIDLRDLTLSQGLAVFLVLFWCAYFWSLRKPIQKWLLYSAEASRVSAREMPEIRQAMKDLLRTMDKLVQEIGATLSPRMKRIEEGMASLLERWPGGGSL